MALKHIAIIPDGNRRWAKERGLPSVEGHRTAAANVLPALLEKARELGIEYFTFWVLSTENAKKRSASEVNYLFRLMRFFIQAKLEELHRKNVRIKIIGDLSALPADIQEGIQASVVKTAANTGITLVLAVNYGGRDEIVRAVRKLVNDGQEITAESIGHSLDTTDIPDPDLIVRSGGEKRTSGFMLWQSEYAEYAFVDEYFPAMTPEILESCVREFESRQRRFGK